MVERVPDKNEVVGSIPSTPICVFLLIRVEYLHMAEAYCVKCRSKREMDNGKEVSMRAKGGGERRAMTGSCTVCGTKMFKILGKKEAELKKAA